MFLYELAIELDLRSTDLADKAVELGMGTLMPAETITPEQAAQLRAALEAKVDARRPDPSRGMPPMAVGTPAGIHASFPPPGPGSSDGAFGRLVRFATIGVVLAAAVGLFAFMAKNSGPDADRQKQVSQELKDWNDAPPATIDPQVAAEAAAQRPSYEPADKAKLCAAEDRMYQYELTLNYDHIQADWAAVRTAAGPGRKVWDQAIADMRTYGPADLHQPLDVYRMVNAHVYDVIAASTSKRDLQIALAQQDRGAESAAIDGLYRIVAPLCGRPGQ